MFTACGPLGVWFTAPGTDAGSGAWAQCPGSYSPWAQCPFPLCRSLRAPAPALVAGATGTKGPRASGGPRRGIAGGPLGAWFTAFLGPRANPGPWTTGTKPGVLVHPSLVFHTSSIRSPQVRATSLRVWRFGAFRGTNLDRFTFCGVFCLKLLSHPPTDALVVLVLPLPADGVLTHGLNNSGPTLFRVVSRLSQPCLLVSATLTAWGIAVLGQ